jgi:hypothetical protein
MILDVSRLSWEKPLLCLDVDGVLNVINRSQNRKTYDIFRSDSGFWIRFRRELPGWLDRLVDHFDLVWCTMWDHNANTELADRLDLPWLPYIDKYVQDMPFAWVDDSFVKGDFTWADWRDNNLAPTKLFQIDPRMGLLEHHVNKLVAWAELIK